MDQSPLLPNTHISSANEENVVKPPQKPVISITFSPGVITCAFSSRPNNRPIMKHQIMFTRNVPMGKEPWNIAELHLPIRNLPQVPTKPPAPANNIILIITTIFIKFTNTTIPERHRFNLSRDFRIISQIQRGVNIWKTALSGGQRGLRIADKGLSSD